MLKIERVQVEGRKLKEVRQVEQTSERINEIEQKITVLTKIIEERFGIKIDFRNDVEKFIDEFVDEVDFISR